MGRIPKWQDNPAADHTLKQQLGVVHLGGARNSGKEMEKRYRRQEVKGAPTKWAVYVKRLGEEKQSDHLK